MHSARNTSIEGEEKAREVAVCDGTVKDDSGVGCGRFSVRGWWLGSMRDPGRHDVGVRCSSNTDTETQTQPKLHRRLCLSHTRWLHPVPSVLRAELLHS